MRYINSNDKNTGDPKNKHARPAPTVAELSEVTLTKNFFGNLSAFSGLIARQASFDQATHHPTILPEFFVCLPESGRVFLQWQCSANRDKSLGTRLKNKCSTHTGICAK